MSQYTIQSGDTLGQLAKSNNTDLASVLKLNPQITDPNKIIAGANLNLPDAKSPDSLNSNSPTKNESPIKIGDSGVSTSDSIINQDAATAADKLAKSQALDQEIADLTKQKQISDLKSSLTGGQSAPAVPDSVGTYNTLRDNGGLTDLEKQLNDVNAQIRAKTDLYSQFQVQEAKTGYESEQFYKGRVREEGVNTQREIDQLNQQASNLTDQINNKNSYINTVMSLTQTDYQNASTKYQNDISNNLNVQQLYNSEATASQNNATAYLSSVANMIKDSGVDWTKVDAATKANIYQQEIKAGWAPGTLEAFAKETPNAQVLGTVAGTDADGNPTTTFIFRDPATGLPGMKYTYSSGSPSSGDSGNEYSTSTDNNPGNITLGPATQHWVDSGQATVKTANGKQFLSFKDPQTGLDANRELMFGPNYSNLTLNDALTKWSGGDYGGEILQGTGLDPMAKMKDLPIDQQNTLLNEVIKREGGKITSSSDYIYGDFVKTLTPEGQQSFNTLGDVQKSNVMSLVRGDIDIPTLMQSRGLAGSTARQKLLSEVKSVDPTYTDNRYKVTQQWNNPNGKEFLTRSSMNTAMSHMATTYEASKSLGNENIPKWNDLSNWFSKNTGNPELTNFVYDLTALSGEIASAYKNGTAPSEQDTQRFYDSMAGSMSPAQFQGAFTQASKLMAGKLKSLAQEYKQSAGRYPTDPIIQPSISEELSKAGIDISTINDLLREQGYPVTEQSSNSSSAPAGGWNDNSDPLKLYHQ